MEIYYYTNLCTNIYLYSLAILCSSRSLQESDADSNWACTANGKLFIFISYFNEYFLLFTYIYICYYIYAYGITIIVIY